MSDETPTPTETAVYDPCDILNRIMELDQQIHDMALEMKRITELYNLGYRYMTPEGEPHMGHDNVVNIAEHLI